MMADFFSRNRAGVLLVFLVSFSLLVLTLRIGPYITGYKTTIWFLFSPEIVYSGQFFNKLDSLRGRLFRLIHAEGENHILRQQNSQLSKREIERDALEDENNRLRSILDLKAKAFPNAVAAEVIGRDLRDWFHAVVINKGSEDGVDVTAAVVAGMHGRPTLVGRVSEVKATTSKILLLTDAISAISVVISRNGDMGLLEGRNKPWGAVTYLPQKSDIAVGDEVITGGLGGIFPPGVPVGEVVKVGDTVDGFFKEAQILPFANLSSLREVLILERKDLYVTLPPAAEKPKAAPSPAGTAGKTP